MKELIVHNEPKSPISEAYRGVRTNLQFANVDHSFKSIMVTSSTAGEGKTTTLCNVAATLADSGYKVIIIDCDLRKPRIHKFFGISNHAGITDILLKGTSYEDYLHNSFHKNISIIPSGNIPTNPSELLNSTAMRKFIDRLKENYDYIFIDTPPVVPVTDAVIMSTYIDRVILVCASGSLEIDMAKKAKESLDRVGANILGVVLNKIPVNASKYQYYYYYRNEEGEKK